MPARASGFNSPFGHMVISLAGVQKLIRVIPDYPKLGIQFQDITPLISDADAFAVVTAALSDVDRSAQLITGIEARGFIFAAAVAAHSRRGFAPIRKAGKLPHHVHSENYGLEYGTDTLQIHQDAMGFGVHTLLVDDVLATGGTMKAALKLIQRSGGVISSIAVVMELTELGGRAAIAQEFPDVKITSLFTI